MLGPGRVRDVMSLYVEDGIKEKLHAGETVVTNDWEKNKASLKGKQKDSNWKQSIRVNADIFTPMIPA